jgi:hypothetical protein
VSVRVTLPVDVVVVMLARRLVPGVIVEHVGDN